MKYFTSSKLVHRLLELDGVTAFEYEVRHLFNTYAAARQWELKVLRRMHVVKSPVWLNLAASSASPYDYNPMAEELRRKKISGTMKIVWENNEYREKQSNLNEKQRHIRRENGRKSADRAKQKRLLNTANDTERTKRYRPTSSYGKVMIVKDGKEKLIHRNQVPAYRKFGWARS